MATQALPTVPQAAGPVGAGTTLVAHILRQVRTRPDRVAMYFRAGERWKWGAALAIATALVLAILLAPDLVLRGALAFRR